MVAGNPWPVSQYVQPLMFECNEDTWAVLTMEEGGYLYDRMSKGVICLISIPLWYGLAYHWLAGRSDSSNTWWILCLLRIRARENRAAAEQEFLSSTSTRYTEFKNKALKKIAKKKKRKQKHAWYRAIKMTQWPLYQSRMPQQSYTRQKFRLNQSNPYNLVPHLKISRCQHHLPFLFPIPVIRKAWDPPQRPSAQGSISSIFWHLLFKDLQLRHSTCGDWSFPSSASIRICEVTSKSFWTFLPQAVVEVRVPVARCR